MNWQKAHKLTEVTSGNSTKKLCKRPFSLQREVDERRSGQRQRMEAEREQALRLAESANQARSQFLANISHEIRTPINSVLGITQLLQQTALSPQQQDYVDKICASSVYLMRLLNDILDFSKIEAGKLSLEQREFWLHDVLRYVSDLFTLEARQKHLTLSFDAPALPYALKGDALRLDQILVNLVSNAIKFTDEGQIDISVQVLEECEAQVTLQFSVQDTGIGLSEEQCAGLFQMFAQVDNAATRKHGGAGLGLSISRSLARLMGGDIWVDSSPGEGSTFHFTVTLERIDALPDAPITSPSHIKKLQDNHMAEQHHMCQEQLQGACILLVEDNEINQEIVSELLSGWDINVTVADHGQKALELLQLQSFDAVLLDIQMPVMDGYQTAAQIRKNPAWNDLVVIAMTANVLEQEREKALQSGMNDFISKPIMPEELSQTLYRCLYPDHDEMLSVLSADSEELIQKQSCRASDLCSAWLLCERPCSCAR